MAWPPTDASKRRCIGKAKPAHRAGRRGHEAKTGLCRTLRTLSTSFGHVRTERALTSLKARSPHSHSIAKQPSNHLIILVIFFYATKSTDADTVKMLHF
jgi:hypothetical protein